MVIQGLIQGGGWMGWLATPLHLFIYAGYYGNRCIIACQSPPIVQYSKIQAATRSATPHGIFLYQYLLLSMHGPLFSCFRAKGWLIKGIAKSFL